MWEMHGTHRNPLDFMHFQEFCPLGGKLGYKNENTNSTNTVVNLGLQRN